MRPLPVLLLLLAVAFAGCADDAPDESDNDAMTGGDEDETIGGDNEAPSEVSELKPRLKQTWYLTTSKELSLELPASGSMTLPGGFSTLAGSEGFPTFQSEPVDAPTLLLPEATDITLYYSSNAPGLHNPVFSYAVWVGSSHSMPLSNIGQVMGPAVPGEINELTFTADWGTRLPIFIPEGESLQAIVAITIDGASDAGQVNLHVGEDTESSIQYTTQEFNIDPTDIDGSPATDTFTGTLSNADLANCGGPEDVTHAFHTVPVSDTASYLRLDSRGQDATGGGDLDIDLFDGSTILGGGHTAGADEGIFFAGPAMAEIQGKSLTLRVTVCLAGNLAYTVDTEQG